MCGRGSLKIALIEDQNRVHCQCRLCTRLSCSRVFRQSRQGLQRSHCILNSFWYLNIYNSSKSRYISSNNVTFVCACITIMKGYLASMTAAISQNAHRVFYLSPYYCYLRQLYDIRAHCVEYILQLVYHGDKSLHVRGV